LHPGQDASNDYAYGEDGRYAPGQFRIDKFAAMLAFLSIGKDFLSAKRTFSDTHIS